MRILYFFIGSIFGSFFFLVAERIPKGGSLLFPASHCINCQRRLRFYELIPLFSIILQKFHCRYCNKKISPLYFFSECICGVIFSYSFSTTIQPMIGYQLLLLLMAYLLSLTDILYLIVEPKILYTTTFLLCVYQLYFSFPFHLLTSVFSLISFALLNSKGKEQLGRGDILLISIWGLFLGSYRLLILLFIASCSGLLFLFILTYVFKKSIRELPFVPFLSIGLFVVLHFF